MIPNPKSSPGSAARGVPGIHPSSDRESPPTARVLAVLEYLATTGDGEVSPADLVKRLGITRSTSRLILSALARGGYASRNPGSGKYRVGPASVALGRAARERSPLLLVVSGLLRRISNEMRVSCSINARSGDDLLVLEHIGETPGATALFARAGVRLPFAAPLGVPFAAYAPEHDVERWFHLAGISAEQRARWIEILESVRVDGYYARPLAPRLENEIATFLDLMVDAGDIATDQGRHAALLAELSSSLRRDQGYEDSQTTNISIPVMDRNGEVELSALIHVPNDAIERGTTQELARRIKSLIETAAALANG